jgi:hypothetical protein
MPFGESASDVLLGPLAGSQATDGDDVQCAIGGASASRLSRCLTVLPDDAGTACAA